MIEKWDLELQRAAEHIINNNAKRVVIQVPDGLKPHANKIVDFLKKNTKADVFIWAGSCYGSCDVPAGLDRLNIDLLLAWGHTAWKF